MLYAEQQYYVVGMGTWWVGLNGGFGDAQAGLRMGRCMGGGAW